MKLHEVIPQAQAIIKAVDELKDIPQFDRINERATAEREEAIEEYGLALVFIQESGEPIDPNATDLLLDNMLIIAVLENAQTNETGRNYLEVTGLVLDAIHQHDWSEPGLRNALVVDNPAYTKVELDSGLDGTFCNFKIKSIG